MSKSGQKGQKGAVGTEVEILLEEMSKMVEKVAVEAAQGKSLTVPLLEMEENVEKVKKAVKKWEKSIRIDPKIGEMVEMLREMGIQSKVTLCRFHENKLIAEEVFKDEFEKRLKMMQEHRAEMAEMKRRLEVAEARLKLIEETAPEDEKSENSEDFDVTSRQEYGRKCDKSEKLNDFESKIRQEYGRKIEKSENLKDFGNKTPQEYGRQAERSGESALAAQVRCMRANVLPDPDVFSGEEHRDLDKFLKMFWSKYKELTNDDGQMILILEEKFLKDEAYKVARTVPQEFKRNFSEFAQEFKQRWKNSRMNERATALESWERLDMEKGQSFVDYCLEVERLALIAFDGSQEQTDTAKTLKLVKAVRKNEVLRTMVSLTRNDVEPGKQYEKLKVKLLQYEYDHRHSKPKPEKVSEKEGNEKDSSSESSKNEKNSSSESSEDEESSSESSEGDEKRKREGRKCFNCGKIGHLARKCRSKRVECDSVRVVKVEMAGIGHEITEKVEIFDTKVEMKVDSGARVSLMSQKLFEKLRFGSKGGCQIKFLRPENFSVVGATGKKLKIIGQVDVPVKLREAEKMIRFQIVKGSENECVLGTNGFVKFGGRIAFKQVEKSGQDDPEVKDFDEKKMMLKIKDHNSRLPTTVRANRLTSEKEDASKMYGNVKKIKDIDRKEDMMNWKMKEMLEEMKGIEQQFALLAQGFNKIMRTWIDEDQKSWKDEERRSATSEPAAM